MVALISLLSIFERPWPTVNFCGLETKDHCNIVYRLSYYGINTNNKYHGREAASIFKRSCHLAYLRALWNWYTGRRLQQFMFVTGVACLDENNGRRIDLQEFIWKRWKIVGGQQLARLAFGLCQGARLCSSLSISPLRLDVPLPLRVSVPSLRMQFAPGCNKCWSHWKFHSWRNRRRQTDRAELGQVRHQLRSTSGQVRFVLLRKTKVHLCLISRLFLPPPSPAPVVLFRSHSFSPISITPLCSDLLQLSFFFPLLLAASNLSVYPVLSFSLLVSVSARE